MVTIEKMNYCDLNNIPEFKFIVEEYTLESSISEMSPINTNLDLYNKLNEVGKMITLAAFNDGYLIGYANFVISPNLHYSKDIAVTESFFIKKDYRKTGAGIFLLKEMERLAKENGAVAFMVSAPSDSKLSLIMEKNKHYRETNKVFFKSLN